VGFKISLIGEDFVEYETARRFAIFLKEIDMYTRRGLVDLDDRSANRRSLF